MRILLANLKLFYQCRRLWLIYPAYVLFLWLVLSLVRLGGEVFLALVTMAVPAGDVVAVMQMELVPKPFSFGLPGHRQNIRRLAFLIGAVISLTGGLLFAWIHGSPGVSPGRFVLVLCVGVCLTGILYLARMTLALVFASETALSFLAVTGVFLLGMCGVKFDPFFLGHPVAVILLGVSMATMVWRWLGRPGWFRQHCTRLTLGSFCLPDLIRNGLSPEEQRRIAVSVNVNPPQPHPAVDRYFLDRIRAGAPSQPARYLWGMAYTTVLPLFLLLIGNWRKGVFWMLLWLSFMLMAGYAPSLAPVFISVLLIAVSSAAAVGSSLFSQMLISGGRRERFYGTSIFMSMFAPLIFVIFMLSILVANAMGSLLPNVPIGGSVWTFHRIPLWFPMLSMIVFPIWGPVGVWLFGRQTGRLVFGVVGIAALLLVLFLRPSPEIALAIMVPLAVLSWLVFISGIHRIALHSDLGRR